ncbi:flagellar basal body-associated protein FliL [Methanolinea mesophila]|uniref:COG1361 S-layer family protein n=1 Tax=Methanolinea mesophila TaxID=547055 RepID=UPI001AE9FB36|nr:hypothetical protein [Methanolinea mesophila]MBP1928841.1 flagellar basal body-associated protein FliL [Methanolinea mesophila]
MRTLNLVLAVLLLLTGCAISGVSAQTSSDAAAQVTVTGVTLDPGVFIEEDVGTITVEITNNGAESVPIRRVTMYDADISILSSSYDTSMYLGAGNTMTFVFTVQAGVPQGIYYPTFSVDFRNAGYLRYPVELRVENDPLKISVLSKPDTFAAGKKDTVVIAVGNPRSDMVNGVVVDPSGNGLDITPSSYFVGNLGSDESVQVPLTITPSDNSVLTILVNYKNGVNNHQSSLQVPIRLGASKLQANPILSNIQVVYENGKYSVTGDVTNAGLQVANSVVVTSGDGATPVAPYQQYVVGSLQPDDFSSFEVTFTAPDNTSTIPLAVQFKDADGNQFEQTTMVEIPPASTGGGEAPGFPLPVIVLLVVLAVVIAGVVWYSWRKSHEPSP